MFEDSPIGAAFLTPPSSDSEFEQRKSGWGQLLQNPMLMAGLFQFGNALMQTGPVGQTSSGHIANALSQGMGAMGATALMQRQNMLQQQEFDRKARITDAQARQADVYTRKAEDDLLHAPEARQREAEQAASNKSLTEARIRASDASTNKSNVEASLLPEQRRMEAEYRRALIKQANAVAENYKVKANTGGGNSNQWTTTKQYDKDTGVLTVINTNKATREQTGFTIRNPLSETQISQAISDENFSRRVADKPVMTAEEETALRAKLSTQEIKPLNIGPTAGSNTPQSGSPAPAGGVTSSNGIDYTSMLENNPRLKMPGSGAPSAPTPSQGQAAAQAQAPNPVLKVDPNTGKVFNQDGSIFSFAPSFDPDKSRNDLNAKRIQLYEETRRRDNAKTPEDKARIQKNVDFLKKELEQMVRDARARKPNKQ